MWSVSEPCFVDMIFCPTNDERHGHDENKNCTSILDGDVNPLRMVRPDVCGIPHDLGGHPLATEFACITLVATRNGYDTTAGMQEVEQRRTRRRVRSDSQTIPRVIDWKMHRAADR